MSLKMKLVPAAPFPGKHWSLLEAVGAPFWDRDTGVVH